MDFPGILVLVAMFPDEVQAGCLLAEFEDRRCDAASAIVDAATLCKDGAGALRVTGAWYRDRRGLFVGGIVATFIGGLAGPTVATAAGGSVLGGLRGRLHSAPLKFELLAVGEQLPPRSSLMIVFAEPRLGDLLTSELRAAAATVLAYELRPPVVDQFNHGGNVAFLFPPDGVSGAGAGPVPVDRDHVRGPLRVEDSIVVSAATLSDEVLPPAHGSLGSPAVDRSPQDAGPMAGSTGPVTWAWPSVEDWTAR